MSSPHKPSELSILSGKYKGIKLKSPDLATTHPMGSREKLALFNMLAPYLEGATVLDYFAGSGALGLEALSRGAASVTFIENNPKALEVIKENLSNFDMGDASRGTPCARSAEGTSTLGDNSRQDPSSKLHFDVIISDPPYDNYQVPDYEKLLKKGGILALSHPKDFNLKAITGLTLLKTHHYAACHISLFTK